MTYAVALPLPSTYAKARQRRPQYWHNELIDLMLANPSMTQGELAAALGKAVNTIHYVVNSDMFKAVYAARRAAHQQKMDDQLREKTFKAGGRALDILNEDLENNPQKYKNRPDLLVTITDKTLERLGYGVKQPAAPATQVNVQNTLTVSREALSAARQRVLDLEVTGGAGSATLDRLNAEGGDHTQDLQRARSDIPYSPPAPRSIESRLYSVPYGTSEEGGELSPRSQPLADGLEDL